MELVECTVKRATKGGVRRERTGDGALEGYLEEG